MIIFKGTSFLETRSIPEINQKIRNGEATVLTQEEV
jgi:hypothetical protein